MFVSDTTGTIGVPKNGVSNPFALKFTDLGFIVTADVKVSVTIPDTGSFGLTVSGSSLATLPGNIVSPRVAFSFATTSSSLIGVQVYVTFAATCVDASLTNWSTSFNITSQILLEVTQISTSPTFFAISSPGFDVVTINSLTFRPYCPRAGMIYYRLQINNIYN